MRHKMAMTKNVRRMIAAVHDLQDRPQGVEGMGLLWGLPGEGKSTTIAFVTNQMRGVFVRANAAWTVTSMLGALCVELRLEPKHRKAAMLTDIVRELAQDPRPVLVDEADYLMRSPDMMDALRDIYDSAGSPVILVGMESMARKVRAVGKLARRITQWIEFSGLDMADAGLLAKTVCEVELGSDLLVHLHQAAKANIGRMVIGLSRIESFARSNGLETVTCADWQDRALFYDQPDFKGRPQCRE